MFEDEHNICQLIETKQWDALGAVLSQIFAAHNQHLHRNYILYLDSCIDYYVLGSPFKPSTNRYSRGVIYSGIESECHTQSLLSKTEINSFASTVQRIIALTDEGKIKTLLEMAYEHIYTTPMESSSDILSRYIDFFEETNFNAPFNSLDRFSTLLNRYYIQLKENYGSVSFSEHNYIIKRLLYLYICVIDNEDALNLLQKEDAIQIINDATKKLSHLCFKIDTLELSIPELFEFMGKTVNSIFSLNINSLRYGYNPQRKQVQLTLVMHEPDCPNNF